MWELFQICFPWLVSIASLVFVVLQYSRNIKKDNKEEANKQEQKFDGIVRSITEMSIKLDTANATANDTMTEVRCITRDMAKFDTRLSVVEKEVEMVKGQIKHE